jgi:hypothetical protein
MVKEKEMDYQKPTWYSTANEEEQALFRDWLVGLLRTGKVNVVFQKKDGEMRDMECTLREELLPKVEQGKKTDRKNIQSLPVFDINKNEWRAFRFDSIKQIKFVLGE